jgi:hypothetical protein
LPIDEIRHIELPEKLDGAFVRSAAYLTKTRGIDRAIVDFAMKNKLIYEDKNHNVVFVGYDENNEIKFAEAKLTNTFMAAAVDENGKKKFHPKNVKGSDKRYSFNIPADTEKYPNSAGILYVFEAPVDLLSHCTLTLMNERIRAKHEGNKPNLSCWQNVNRLSLSGCSGVALESYLERNPQIHKIVFALDYDNAGIKAAQSMEERFSEKGYSCSKIRPLKGKDFNEYLQITLLEREKQNTNQNNQDTIGVDRSESSGNSADTVRYIQHSVKR